jgi:hypothetical protein
MKEEYRGKFFILITAALAYLVGWSFIKGQRPIIIQRHCSDAAELSSRMYNPKMVANPSLGYDYLLSQCLQNNGL